jgi:isocitrate dehydrogenase
LLAFGKDIVYLRYHTKEMIHMDQKLIKQALEAALEILHKEMKAVTDENLMKEYESAITEVEEAIKRVRKEIEWNS